MASKAPRKKESKDQVATKDNQVPATLSEERSLGKRKPPIPLWIEWSDQDIANEKWDTGKKEKERGRSPNANLHYFDDPEGGIELPTSLRDRVNTWKRPTDIFNEKAPVVVSNEYLNESNIDFVRHNEHIADSELIRCIISTFTSLLQVFASTNEDENVSNSLKIKPSISKEQNNSKMDKSHKDFEMDDICWKPWHLIWPKESSKSNLPMVNSSGKYAVKIFWMGCQRKIIVDDSIPCDMDMKPLLPLTARGNELWPLILSKALIKVASLDYYGGRANSEFGDINFIYCLIGWIPEQIPLSKYYGEEVWKFLLELLPNWKLPQPSPPVQENINKNSSPEDVTSKMELTSKESKDSKNKKDDKLKDDKKLKVDKLEKDIKPNKEKISPRSSMPKISAPNVLLFASFNNPPSGSRKVSELKEMADASEKLRQFGLSHNFPHPLQITMARNCPLTPLPVPIQIPRWKLIRQKKKREPVDPPQYPVEPKDHKFLEMNSPFFNFKVSSLGSCNSIPPTKWEKFKPATPMESVSEEELCGTDERSPPNIEILSHSNSSAELQQTLRTPTKAMFEDNDLISNKKNRSLSISSQINIAPGTKASRGSKSNKDIKKTILKDTKSSESKQSPLELTLEHSVPDDADLKSSADFDETEVIEGSAKENEKKKIWMDFDDFCHCFKTLWIYHKPKRYIKHSTELKSLESKSDRSKKGSQYVTSVRNTTLSPTSINVGGSWMTDPTLPFLLVDCIDNTEVVISFASFSRWFDPNLNLNLGTEDEDEQSLIKALTPKPGSLIVEPYSWKDIVIDSPVIRITTTGIKAAAINLPPGRHVLRLVTNAPLGYHICITSSHQFVFDDENAIMQHLTKESSRFIEHGKNVLLKFKSIAESFNATSLPSADIVLLIGTEERSNEIRREHFKVLMKSITEVLKLELADGFTPQMYFALEALKYEAYFHLKKFKAECKRRRPISTTISSRQHSSEKIQCQQHMSLPDMAIVIVKPDEYAATRIQAVFRRYYIMKLKKAHIIGTAENLLVADLLYKIWNHVEANMESVAVQLYRTMFNTKPNLLKYFPFHADDWNKIVFADYIGSYAEQPADTFYVLYRQVFAIENPMLMMVKFYCNVPACHLKIINNDTCEETKTVFMKVVPQILKPNKQGYTVVVYGRTDSNLIPAGKCRLRVIGEKEMLPSPVRDIVNCSFFTKEIKDYYNPNRYHKIFRYKVKVLEDIVASIQFQTSKEDIYIKFQIFDNDVEIVSCEGKGYLVLPAILFYKDILPLSDESKKSSGSNSRSGSSRSSTKGTSSRRPSSTKSTSPLKAKKKSVLSVEMKDSEEEEEAEVEEEQIHKYILQAYVLRDSWPLTKKQWNFVETLKNGAEKIEAEESTGNVKVEAPAKNSARNRKKGAKGVSSRPESQMINLLDTTKAHWTVRFVVDANVENAVDIKKDTEREDEIKAIKAAWESVEPGRAAKARQSRLKYLESHIVTPINDKKKDGPTEGVETEKENNKENNEEENERVTPVTSPLLSEPDTEELFNAPPVKDSDPIYKQFDVFPYIRSTGKKIHLDECEEEKSRLLLQKKFSKFEERSSIVLAMRENDRIARNLEKDKQLREYEDMQLQLDARREEMYKARDLYMQKFTNQTEDEPVEIEGEKRKGTNSPKRNTPKAAKLKGKKK